MKYTQKDLSKFIEKLLCDEASRFCKFENKSSSVEDYLRHNLYFVTVTFNPIGNQFNQQSGYGPAAVRDAFTGWYCKVCQTIIGNAWKRKIPLQPLTFFALDAEGSRAGSVAWRSASNIHVHALMLMHPQTKDAVYTGLLHTLADCDNRIDGIGAQLFDPNEGSLYNLADYCSKAVFGGDDYGQLYDFLPVKMVGRSAAIDRYMQSLSPQQANVGP